MKKSIMKPEIAKENSENYENRIPMRLWAEDDLPSQKLLLKGTGTLSDAELAEYYHWIRCFRGKFP